MKISARNGLKGKVTGITRGRQRLMRGRTAVLGAWAMLVALAVAGAARAAETRTVVDSAG